MPEIGLLAPERTFVAVRAIVPVTQIPPNSEAATLATPCATSSQFERCRRPLMESATTADSRLSIEPSSAKETAAGSAATIFAGDRSGRCGAGREDGMPPNRLPIVAMSSPAAKAESDATATAIRSTGQCGRYRRTARITARVRTATATVGASSVPAAAASAVSFGISGPGSAPGSVSPKNSRSWVEAMITAMPAVKPTVTG